jgi:hypothetical protein
VTTVRGALVVALVRDPTERKRAEAAIVGYNGTDAPGR